MKELTSRIIRTTCGKPFDLSKAAPLASNVTAPYGKHNYIIYKTIKGFYLKSHNSGTGNTITDSFELISQSEAMYYLQKQLDNRLAAASHA